MTHASKHTTSKIFALTFVVALVLFGVVAATAAASPGYAQICSDCHTGLGAAPTVNITSAAGADPVHYSVSQASTAWAAFDLSDNSTRLAGDSNSTGTFTAPAGHFVRVCAADGASTGTWSQAYFITPAAPSHGTITPAAQQLVASGASSTVLTITADAGYHLTDVTINGVSNATAVSTGQYTFTNVLADGKIAATFAVDSVTPTKCIATIALTGLKSGVLKLHKAVIIKGVVTPAHSGNATVTIQRKAGSKWVVAKTIARPMKAATGAYSCSYKPTKAGTYRVKTSVTATALYTAATTAYKTFKVK
jgi:hypothetical protein